jgi:hypothetical protein
MWDTEEGKKEEKRERKKHAKNRTGGALKMKRTEHGRK